MDIHHILCQISEIIKNNYLLCNKINVIILCIPFGTFAELYCFPLQLALQYVLCQIQLSSQKVSCLYL